MRADNMIDMTAGSDADFFYAKTARRARELDDTPERLSGNGAVGMAISPHIRIALVPYSNSCSMKVLVVSGGREHAGLEVTIRAGCDGVRRSGNGFGSRHRQTHRDTDVRCAPEAPWLAERSH
jgi:hypothetical protein